jgi:hypothetical protein
MLISCVIASILIILIAVLLNVAGGFTIAASEQGPPTTVTGPVWTNTRPEVTQPYVCQTWENQPFAWWSPLEITDSSLESAANVCDPKYADFKDQLDTLVTDYDTLELNWTQTIQ